MKMFLILVLQIFCWLLLVSASRWHKKPNFYLLVAPRSGVREILPGEWYVETEDVFGDWRVFCREGKPYDFETQAAAQRGYETHRLAIRLQVFGKSLKGLLLA